MSDFMYLESNEIIKKVYQHDWEDEFSFDSKCSHTETFISYLKLIGHNSNSICAKPNTIKNFENFLEQIVNSNTNNRLIVFGTIEFIYIFISGIIHKYVTKERGTVLEVHYSLHEVLDIDHSLEFLNLVDFIDYNLIDQTIYNFLNLYQELYEINLVN